MEIERYIVELGSEGRLIEMQLEETMVGVAGDKAALLHDYLAEPRDDAFAIALDGIARLAHQDLLDFGRLAELLGYDRKVNTLDYPSRPAATASWAASPAPEAGGAKHRPGVPRAGRSPCRDRPRAGVGRRR